MIEFGKTLRAAREAKGYDIRQLAELTRMAPTTIQELESENFSRIPAPIYGRGFVKLYCEAVGIEAKPLVDEFMEIYSGNRDTEIKERPLQTVPEQVADTPVEAPAPEPPAKSPLPEPTPIPKPEPDLFHQDSAPVAPKSPATTTSPSVAFDNEPEHPSISRYAAPVRQAYASVTIGTYLRLGILAIGAILLLGLLLWGIRSVYRATTRPAEGESTVVAPAMPALAANKDGKPPSTTTKQKTRTPQKIPSLYMD